MLNAVRIKQKFPFHQPIEPQALFLGSEKGREMENWDTVQRDWECPGTQSL